MPRGRKQPKASQRRKRPISATEARRRALRPVVRQMFGGAKVADGKHARMSVYNLPTENAWVVFKNSRELLALRSSEAVVVCKRTGRVLYEGPANDDG
ncbi:MAG: hypothetical protein RL514_1250 [Verrucomicrobiota bacterium]|jgi:hypothetical protein